VGEVVVASASGTDRFRGKFRGTLRLTRK